MPNTPRKPRALSEQDQQFVRRVIDMYREGWFPMHDARSNRVEWVQPQNRTLIPIEVEKFHISRSLRRRVRRGGFVVTSDRAFVPVIRGCAAPAKGREETWINRTIIDLFTLLHRAGVAHSVEVWRVPGVASEGGPAEPGADKMPGGAILVGGIYGLQVGRVFAGESMYSRPALGGTDASKVALVHLVHHLRRRGYRTLDAQLTNPHLLQFGSHEVPRDHYLRVVEEEPGDGPAWEPFEPWRTVEELTP